MVCNLLKWQWWYWWFYWNIFLLSLAIYAPFRPYFLVVTFWSMNPWLKRFIRKSTSILPPILRHAFVNWPKLYAIHQQMILMSLYAIWAWKNGPKNLKNLWNISRYWWICSSCLPNTTVKRTFYFIDIFFYFGSKQRTARFSTSKKFFSSKRKVVIEIQRINENVSTAPLASETNEGDEIARKILQDVSSLVDDNEMAHGGESSATGGGETNRTENKETASGSGGAVKKSTTFVYALPGEVLKTSLNRHQRGIMDSRIYQLLTKKEIILPQVIPTFRFSLLLCSTNPIEIVQFSISHLTDSRRRAISWNPIDSSILSSGTANDLRDSI